MQKFVLFQLIFLFFGISLKNISSLFHQEKRKVIENNEKFPYKNTWHSLVLCFCSSSKKKSKRDFFLIKSLSNSWQSLSHNKVIIFYENVEPLAMTSAKLKKLFQILFLMFFQKKFFHCGKIWLIFTWWLLLLLETVIPITNTDLDDGSNNNCHLF